MSTKTTINLSNLTDDGFDAVMAIAAGGSFTFDGRYSNADVVAIADAFTVKTGKRPSSSWLADLRYTEATRNDGACYEGKILDRQDAAVGDYL